MNETERAKLLAANIFEHHKHQIHTEIRDAIIVKTVALVSLCYGIPPSDDGEVETDQEICTKLLSALEEIRAFECTVPCGCAEPNTVNTDGTKQAQKQARK
jgi:hypothetical protein